MIEKKLRKPERELLARATAEGKYNRGRMDVVLQSKSEQRAAAELCRLNLGCIVGCRDDLTPSAFRAKRMPEAELINLFSLPKAARA